MSRFFQNLFDPFKKRKSNGLQGFSEEFLRSINLIVGLDQLLDAFSSKLREMLGSETLYVVLFEPITDRYVGERARGGDPVLLEELNFSRFDNLVKWLNVNRSVLDVVTQAEVVAFLSPREQALLERTKTVLIVPLIVVNRLTGALFVGRRANGVAYSASDVQTVTVLASQSALAIEHALMYQFQEEKLKKLFQADKLATIGELAAGAAHEIRNPLTSIRSTVQYLQSDLPGEKKMLVEGIIEEVDRIDAIIKGLLSLSKSSELQLGPVNVEDAINQTLLLLDPELKKNDVRVEKEVKAADTTIVGDAAQLRQVFLNVLLNSVQAMPTGGFISLSLTEDSYGEAQGASLEKVGGGKQFLSITIKDTGFGIPEKELSKVFDPFYTTKEAGTGLGLSISYGIVSKHGGEIEIKSVAEGSEAGATVIIRLPKLLRDVEENKT